MTHLTDAQLRTLTKARDVGFVMIYGAFSGDESGFEVDLPNFDRRMHVERLVGWKMLTLGKGFNQYVLTGAGASEVAEREARRRRTGEKVAA